MRQSRQSSAISQNDKIKYPKCERKKEHNKESLNFICLTPNCKFRGLICIQCKGSTDHTAHNIQPLKAFLIKMDQTLKKIQSQKSIKMVDNQKTKDHRALLQKLQQTHIQILSTLRIQLQQVSSKIQVCEEQILIEYGRAREKILSEFQKQTLVCKSLEEIQLSLYEEKEKEGGVDLRLSILKLLHLLKIQKNDIIIQNEAEIQFNSYTLAANAFKTNMLIWEKETNAIIGEVFKLKPEYQLKETKIRPTTALEATIKSPPIFFAPQLKTDSIQLSSENKVAKVKDDKSGKVVLLSEKAMDWKSTPVKFKIATLSSTGSIQIGACLKAQVNQKLYKFQKNNLQHGYYVCSSNGIIYSSNDQGSNNTKNGLSFKSGDQITIQIDHKDTKMNIKKKNDAKNYSISLKHLSQNDWKDLHFCVSLNAKDDKVQILA